MCHNVSDPRAATTVVAMGIQEQTVLLVSSYFYPNQNKSDVAAHPQVHHPAPFLKALIFTESPCPL